MSEIPPPPKVFIPPKNETPLKGVVIYSVIVLVAIIGLANLYAILNIYLPLRIVKTLLPFGYCLSLGYLMSWGVYLGKIKGLGNVILLAFFGSLISVYFLWVIWTSRMLGESMFHTMGSLFQGIQNINVDGVYIKGELVAGVTALKALWVIETAFIFLVPIFVIDEKPPKIDKSFFDQ